MFTDSPGFSSTDVQPTESSASSAMSSSSSSSQSKFQWPSKKNRQSIPSSTFYRKSHCDTTSNMETSSENQPTDADLYRKSKSILLSPADRENYKKELNKIQAKQSDKTGGSSLLNALDEDYGVRNRKVDERADDLPVSKFDPDDSLTKITSNQTATGASSLLNALDVDYCSNIRRSVDERSNSPSLQSCDQPNGNSDALASSDGGDSEQKTESQEKSFLTEESNEDSEDVIPCTPPPPSLKRKAGTNKKQIKITDIYTKLNVN